MELTQAFSEDWTNAKLFFSSRHLISCLCIKCSLEKCLTRTVFFSLRVYFGSHCILYIYTHFLYFDPSLYYCHNLSTLRCHSVAVTSFLLVHHVIKLAAELKFHVRFYFNSTCTVSNYPCWQPVLSGQLFGKKICLSSKYDDSALRW